MSSVQAVDRAFAILECFDARHHQRTVGEIAERTGLARPTIYRLLQTLTQLGYVHHTGGRFELTARVLRFADAYAGPSELAGRAQPILDRLAAEVDEHVALGVLDGDDVIAVAVARSSHSRLLAIALDVGQRLPASDTALGRVLLAHAADETSASGYAIADGLIEHGLRSIAVPVRDQDGEVVASLAVAVNAARLTIADLERAHLPAMLAAARDLNALT